jgi:hypothetical protein
MSTYDSDGFKTKHLSMLSSIKSIGEEDSEGNIKGGTLFCCTGCTTVLCKRFFIVCDFKRMMQFTIYLTFHLGTKTDKIFRCLFIL